MRVRGCETVSDTSGDRNGTVSCQELNILLSPAGTFNLAEVVGGEERRIGGVGTGVYDAGDAKNPSLVRGLANRVSDPTNVEGIAAR
jgi:hypothetical protein